MDDKNQKEIGTLSFTLKEYKISAILFYTSILSYIKKMYYPHFTHDAPQSQAFSILHLDFTEQIIIKKNTYYNSQITKFAKHS